MEEAIEKFLDNYITVGGGSTKTNGADFTSKVFDITDSVGASIMMHIKGTNALATGNITFTFQFYEYVDDETPGWEWVNTPYTVSMNGMNDVCVAVVVPKEVTQVKLASIANAGTSGNDANCNAALMEIRFNNLEYANKLISSLRTALNN